MMCKFKDDSDVNIKFNDNDTDVFFDGGSDFSLQDFTDTELSEEIITKGKHPKKVLAERKKYGDWTVLKDLGTRVTGNYYCKKRKKLQPQITRYFLCRCKCGKVAEKSYSNLVFGQTKSCRSCHMKGHKRNVRHGMSKTSEWLCWSSMRVRCYRKSNKLFKYYGGRGITVCDRWLESFENFFADMGKKPTPEHSIDRINNNGNYEPGNCRWATKKQQVENRRPIKKKNEHN